MSCSSLLLKWLIQKDLKDIASTLMKVSILGCFYRLLLALVVPLKLCCSKNQCYKHLSGSLACLRLLFMAQFLDL